MTFDPPLKQNKKEEFSTLKPDWNKTKRVLKTDKSVSSGKTRIHSRELQLSDFHHKLNVSSLADLLWQTHKRSMLKNKTQSEKWHATSSGAGRPSLQCISIPALVFAIWFVRSPCIPVQTQSLIKIEGHTLLDIRIADGRTCVPLAWQTCSPAPPITHAFVYVTGSQDGFHTLSTLYTSLKRFSVKRLINFV